MSEEKLKKLIQDIRYSLRITLVIFVFFVGVILGQLKEVNIYYLRYIIIFCIGIMFALGYTLSKLEDE